MAILGKFPLPVEVIPMARSLVAREILRLTGGQPVWRDGTWTLQMTRSLAAHEKGEIAMVSGQKLLVAFAVWNGSVDSHTASKSVSTWHTLELDRSAATSDRAAATSRTGLR